MKQVSGEVLESPRRRAVFEESGNVPKQEWRVFWYENNREGEGSAEAKTLFLVGSCDDLANELPRVGSSWEIGCGLVGRKLWNILDAFPVEDVFDPLRE
ncbi:unnamed protein product [Peronospora belbahrii]|uniref:Amine oxidase domain-containing protein n=1 Tax=Peronospora belbahrii TaxID=622444 RepID=A0AAU9LN18_9STRA|nr:unnamed protein product [Peronospora belbahrii]